MPDHRASDAGIEIASDSPAAVVGRGSRGSLLRFWLCSAKILFWALLPIGLMVAYSCESVSIESKSHRPAFIENVAIPDAADDNFAPSCGKHDVGQVAWSPDRKT